MDPAQARCPRSGHREDSLHEAVVHPAGGDCRRPFGGFRAWFGRLLSGERAAIDPLSESDAHPRPWPARPVSGWESRMRRMCTSAHPTDPWLKESWYTEAQSFDIVVTNTSDFSIDDVYLLVTIPRAFKDVPGWSVQVGDQVLGPCRLRVHDDGSFRIRRREPRRLPAFRHRRLLPVFDGGHLDANASWTVPVIATRGTADGFRLHFDAGSTRLWTPPSHDVTVLPPVGDMPAPEACCFDDGHCELLSAEGCVGAGGTAGGAGSSCDPNPCPPTVPTGACCLDGGGCTTTTEEGCLGIGSYQGPGSLCDLETCSGD